MPQPVGPAICRRRSPIALSLVGRQPHPQLDAVIELDDVERLDLVRRLHDAFAEEKPMAKSLRSSGVPIITA